MYFRQVARYRVNKDVKRGTECTSMRLNGPNIGGIYTYVYEYDPLQIFRKSSSISCRCFIFLYNLVEDINSYKIHICVFSTCVERPCALNIDSNKSQIFSESVLCKSQVSLFAPMKSWQLISSTSCTRPISTSAIISYKSAQRSSTPDTRGPLYTPLLPIKSPPSAMVRSNENKEPFAPVHQDQNVMRARSTGRTNERSASTSGVDKYNPYLRHEPSRHFNPRQNPQQQQPYGAMPRPQSTTRARAPTSRLVEQHQRPRPISTGRMVHRNNNMNNGNNNNSNNVNVDVDVDDPESVTKAILDLRDKREQSQLSRASRSHLKQHPLHQHRSQSSSVGEHQQMPLSPTSSSLTPQEQVASFKLKEAETRIGSLMQELEELRFFHEIDMEPAKDTSPTKSFAGTPRAAPQTPPRRSMLSPRKLSVMDRNTLELEAQELQRQVELLMQEQSSLHAKVQVMEAQEKAAAQNAKHMETLESSLKEIRGTLSDQRQEIHHGRAVLTDEYETKLKGMKKECRQSQTEADELAHELTALQKEYRNIDEEYEVFRHSTEEQLEQLQEKWEKKEEAMEQQLAETVSQVDSYQQTVEDREHDAMRLQRELTESRFELELSKKELKDHYGTQTSYLELLVREQEEMAVVLQATLDAKASEVTEQAAHIAALEKSRQEKSETLQAVQTQLLELDDKHVSRIEELKRTSDAREHRRLDDLVESQHSKNREYEERLTDIRKQLTLATDRHHAEMEQKEVETKERLEATIQQTEKSARMEYEPKLTALREELEKAHKKYDVALQETMRHQVRAESKDRDTAREIERHTSLRSVEIDRLQDKLDRALREVGEKDTKVQSLVERLAEIEKHSQTLLTDLESQHEEEIKARDEMMMQRKLVAKLKTDVSRKESQLAIAKEELEGTLEALQSELDQKTKMREDNASVGGASKTRLRSIQQSLENAQKELFVEQARHESIESEHRVSMAKLEGKLSATEATLKEKRMIIEDLEVKLMNADAEWSNAGTKLQSVITSLRRELLASKLSLEQANMMTPEKDEEIQRLKQELDTSSEQLNSKIAALEDSLKKTEEKLLVAEQSKSDTEDGLRRLRGEQEEALYNLQSISTDKEEVSIEAARMQKEMKDRARMAVELHDRLDSYEVKVSDLQKLLDDKEQESQNYEEEVSRLKASLQNAVDISVGRATDVANSQQRITELERRLNSGSGLQVRITELENDLQNSNEMQKKLEAELERSVEAQKKMEHYLETSSAVENNSQMMVEKFSYELAEKESKHEAMATQLQVIMNERAEAIDALEQMIEEVQLRQDEFDQLADILDKREEELENAKLIATKALASAQEIKSRYKVQGSRESDRHANLELKIDELSASVEYLTGKNDKLRNKTLRLEAELQKRNKECAKLRDDVREQETKSTQSSSIGPPAEGFMPVDEGSRDLKQGKLNNFMLMETSQPESQSEFMMMETGFSIQENASSLSSDSGGDAADANNTADLGVATKWLHDFEDGKSVFSAEDSAKSEPSPPKGQQTAERDALRKYVRRRYLKRQKAAGNN
jgi:chromosome segregation ATPase